MAALLDQAFITPVGRTAVALPRARAGLAAIWSCSNPQLEHPNTSFTPTARASSVISRPPTGWRGSSLLIDLA